MTKATVWVTKTKSVGLPKVEDFKCIEEDLAPCKDGEIIVEAEVFSVDPYMRYRIRQSPVGAVVTGSQVARVIESKNEDYPVGMLLVGYPGWRSHTLLTKEQLSRAEVDPTCFRKMPNLGELPKSLALGTIGMPGSTAYFGFLEICKPQAGDTVVVNAAAGAVGAIVCQIAKIKGCKVLAFAGSMEKLSWLKEQGVDHAFNYKTVDVSEVLTKFAPDGVNCYFDNVGGKFTADLLPHMALFGRVSICGCISSYNDEGSKALGKSSLTGAYEESVILTKQLKVEGFLVHRWWKRNDEALQQLRTWVDEGKLKYKETVRHGFNSIPDAFISLFHGENIGKMVVVA